MKKLLYTLAATLGILALGGCLASTTSPVGVNCDFSKELPLWEMPLVCQGR
ncbi:MAG: hypothetical protein ACOYK2_08510 [Polynucleobacter sp.]